MGDTGETPWGVLLNLTNVISESLDDGVFLDILDLEESESVMNNNCDMEKLLGIEVGVK